MDISMQMKSVDVMVRFLTHDLAHISKVEYYPQKAKFQPKPSPAPLPRSTPEKQGMKSAALERMFRRMDEAEDVNPHSCIVLRHGKVVAEGHWAPFRADVPHMLYSMSKSITATAIGMAVDEGILSLDERLVDLFKDKTPATAGLFLRKVTLRHLLTMSVGIRFNEVGSVLSEDWERMYMESLPKFEPGTAFEYNSMNSYMLAAALRRKTGMSLVEFLTPRLFEPLGIAHHEWEICPRGTEKGGWGLALRVEDAAKIGQLYLQRGLWEVNGVTRRLLSEKWIEEATRVQIETPNGECKKGYGYQIWMSPISGAYQFNGAFGQYVVILPEYDAVVAIMSGSTRLFAQGSLMEILGDCFREGCEKQPLPEDAAGQSALSGVLSSLKLRALPPLVGACHDTERFFPEVADALAAREYRMEDNIASMYPLILQCIHANFTTGVDFLRFEREEGGLAMYLYEGSECNVVHIAPGEEYRYQHMTRRGENQLVGVRTEWRRDPDGAIMLRVTLAFVETPDSRVITAFFKENTATLVFDEIPDVGSATAMLFELTGVSYTDYLRKLLPELRKHKLGGKIRQIIAPDVKATRVLVHENLTEFTPSLPGKN